MYIYHYISLYINILINQKTFLHMSHSGGNGGDPNLVKPQKPLKATPQPAPHLQTFQERPKCLDLALALWLLVLRNITVLNK